MSQDNTARFQLSKGMLTITIVVVSIVGIVITAAIAMIIEPKDTINIFNILLPVFASWVGTILAYYYGRENFESASQEMRKMANDRFQFPEKMLISTAMRKMSDIDLYIIEKGKSEADVKIKDLKDFVSLKEASRLPILDLNSAPKYMIHTSVLNSADGQGGTLTLQDFIKDKKESGKMQFDVEHGFVIVSENEKLGVARDKMIKSNCQDIFVTRNGGREEPLIGWLSNIRLAKFLEA